MSRIRFHLERIRSGATPRAQLIADLMDQRVITAVFNKKWGIIARWGTNKTTLKKILKEETEG